MRQRFLLVALAMTGFSLAGCERDSNPTSNTSEASWAQRPKHADSKAAVRSASRAVDQGRLRLARKRLRPLLLAQPDHPQALFLVARCQAAEGTFLEAVETLDAIPEDHPEAGLAALGQSADWLIQAGHDAQAEQRLRHLLELNPDAAPAHRRLAQLLNNQGRRIEAAPHLRALARLGEITENELYGLGTLSDPFVHRAAGSDKTSPDIEPSRLTDAKILWYEGNLREARRVADQAWAEIPQSAAAAAFCGRVYAELNDIAALQKWTAHLPRRIERQPEYWYALGTWRQQQGEHEHAIRCFLEAVRRDETDRYSYLGLARCLEVSGRGEAAERVLRRHALLDEAAHIVTELKRTPDQLKRLSQILDRLHRPWEARAWRKVAGGATREPSADVRAELQAKAERPGGWATCGLEPENFPMPSVSHLADEPARPDASSAPAARLVLRDVAGPAGLDFQYQPDAERRAEALLMHQTVGGGIAAADYDLDGWPDLYFTQGGGRPPAPDSSRPNQLFRNRASEAFQNVSARAGVDDRGFGHGAAAADINQDGFPDLVVANFGPNVLFLNNADGTFTRRTLTARSSDSSQWTASVACGDLTGDALPDIAEINYIDYVADPEVTAAVCSGKTSMPLCNPQRYRAARDRFWKNRGDGRMEPWEAAASAPAPGYGFAAVIADFDRSAGNDLFVANDTSVNHYWRSQPGADSSDGFTFREQAQLFGCARSIQGVPQSCMGVASGDFDRNGRLDLHITNYIGESSDIFLQQSSGLFINRAVPYGLDLATRAQMGWGTQACDFDCDGWLDLAILNGNLYHQARDGSPYRMRPQLFRGSRDRFDLLEPDDSGDSYWSTPTLGRTLAKLDWNRDGKTDLVANHLDAPVALLENRSGTGDWLGLELVGTESERDAIGTEVVIRVGQEEWTRWVTAGDGYLCSNDPVLSVGLGDASTVSEIEVRWPSGAVDTYEHLAANNRYLIVEGAPAPLAR